MTTREIEVSAELIDSFEAAVEVLERAVVEGAFKEIVNQSPDHYAIGWATLLTGARYDFRFESSSESATRVEAVLEFSGLMGPVLRRMREGSNGPHLEKILADIKSLAESEEFYQDEGGDDAEPDEADEPDEAEATA